MNRIIGILLILISSCKESVKTDETNIKQKTQIAFQLPNTEYTILTYNPKWHWTFKEDVQPSQLNQSELIEIEHFIKTAIKQNNELQKNNLNNHNKKYPDDQITQTGYELKLKGFKRQYIPIINDEGQKIVLINFFCDALEEEDWKTKIIQVEDGGNCYYNLKVNVTTKEYYELEINYSL